MYVTSTYLKLKDDIKNICLLKKNYHITNINPSKMILKLYVLKNLSYYTYVY